MDVKGMGAVVTGGASGLGAETARHLAAAGAKVAVLDLAGDAAEALAAEIGGLGMACDVGDAGRAEAAMAQAREAHGPVRVLGSAGTGKTVVLMHRANHLALKAFAGEDEGQVSR